MNKESSGKSVAGESSKAVLKRRLLVRDYPREAALLGFTGSFFSWMILLPLCVYLMATGSGSAPKLIWLVSTVYFQLMAGTGYYALQGVDGGKGSRVQSVLAGLFWPIAGIVFMPAMKRREGRWSGVMGLISLMCGVIGMIGGMPGAWLLVWICLIAMVISISCLPIGGPIRFKGWLPLLIILAYVLSMSVYRGTLEELVDSRCHGVSAAVGHSMMESEFWKREADGLSVTDEPMKTLIARYKDTLKAGNDLDKLKREHPEFMKAVTLLTSLPVCNIGHVKPASGHYTDMVVPELPALRRAAQVCALELTAGAEKKDVVLAANVRLTNLRDRCFKTSSLVARWVGLDIEAMRVEALTAPLMRGTLSEQDWKKVLGQKIGWEEAFRQAMGDEATSLLGIFVKDKWAPDVLAGDKEDAGLKLVRSLLPLEMSVWSLRDQVYALEKLQELSGLVRHGMTDGQDKAEEFIKKVDHDTAVNLHLVSKNVLPALALSVSQFARSMDQLELLKAAVAVMDYRKKQGKLPESLKVMAVVPKSTLNGQTIAYEEGTLKMMREDGSLRDVKGFRVYVPEEGVEPYQVKTAILVEL